MKQGLFYATLLLFLVFIALFGSGVYNAVIDQALVGREFVKASLIPGFLAVTAWFIWIRQQQLAHAR